MARAAAAVLALPLAAAAISMQTLWTAYEPAGYCYRQPILLTLPNNRLLAIAEARTEIGWCSGTGWPDTPFFTIVARSSPDGGASWGPQVNITAGNLDFLVSVYDAVTDTVWLAIQEGEGDTIMTSSPDGGASWTQPALLTLPGGDAYSYIIPGVGHGLQVSSSFCNDPLCGGTVGRLLLPFVFAPSAVVNDTAGSTQTGLIYSDNHGGSWQIGAVSSQLGSREAALVQGDSSSPSCSSESSCIYLSERNLSNDTGFRFSAVSRDGGASFDPARYANDFGLPDVTTGNWTGVVSGLARFDTPSRPGSPLFVFTAPATPGARANLSAFVSVDEGTSWGGASATLWAGPAAYSDLLQISPTSLGLLFENGEQEFAGRISFATLGLADLPPLPPSA